MTEEKEEAARRVFVALRAFFSRWKGRYSERIRNPRRLWLRRLFASLGIVFAVWAIYNSLTYSGPPYARSSEGVTPWLRAKDSLIGVAIFLGSIAYLLPRTQSDVGAVLLVVTEVALWGWVLSFLVLAVVLQGNV